MAQPKILQSQYSRGSISDLPRHLLPQGSVWKTRDYLPDHEAPLRKRGGWGDASPNLGGVRTDAVGFAPFSAGQQLVAIDNTGHLWKVTSPAAATDKGAAIVPIQRPIFFQNLLIVPGATPKKYDGAAAPSALAGAPPALFGDAFKSRLVLAGSAANPNYVWLSDVLGPETWDLANTFIPVTQPVTGIAALRNVILVFSGGMTERIRGDIPPPGGDMVREPIFQEGCTDARSITTIGDKVIWANGNGVWISDGAAADNLIQLGGLLQYWTALLEGYSAATWTLAGGVIRGHYVISICNGDTFVDALMCDIESKTWSFLGNLRATMFAEAYGTNPELFFSMRARTRLGALEQIFAPDITNMNDGDGTPVQPVLETMHYRGKPRSSRFKNLYVGNDILVPGGSTTYLELAYARDPEAQSYTVLTEDDGVTPRKVLPSGGMQRSRVPVGLASNGISWRIRQVGGSYDTQLFDLETDVHDREGNR